MSLEGSLTATVDGSGVRFSFAIENPGDDPVEMRFSDAQRFDVTVEADGETVWRFGEGQLFAQMLSSAELGPGETAEFDAEWSDPPAGEYEATAVLTATDADCTARAEFSV